MEPKERETQKERKMRNLRFRSAFWSDVMLHLHTHTDLGKAVCQVSVTTRQKGSVKGVACVGEL